MNFSKSQIKQIAEILGNLSVALITAGSITPIFATSDFDYGFWGFMLISISGGGFLAFISILLVENLEI